MIYDVGTPGTGYIESNTDKSERQGNLWHPEGVGDFPVLHFLPVFDFISHFYCSCVLFDSYVFLADDHVNNVSYFPFMSIKKVVPYICVLREGYL